VFGEAAVKVENFKEIAKYNICIREGRMKQEKGE
jgi:hypothetical protein